MSDDDKEDPTSNVREFESLPGGKPKLPPGLENFEEFLPGLLSLAASLGLSKPPTPEEARAREEFAAWERFVLASLQGGQSVDVALSNAVWAIDEWKKRRPEAR
jgi:hypothetical protein